MTTHRFVWHPAVHAAFKEHLLFLVVNTGRRFSASTPQLVEDLLTSVGLSSYNIYATYGRASIMIRCWINDDQEGKLQHEISVRGWRITENLVCTDTYYLWDKRFREDFDPKDVPTHIDEIIDVSKRRSTNFDPRDPSIQTLAADGLIYVVPEREAGSIKLYTVVDHMPAEGDREAVKKRLLALLHGFSREGGPLQEITFHCCKQDSFLIKGVVSDFSDLFAVTTQVADVLQDEAYSSSTFLVANSITAETDQIEINVELSLEERMLASILNRRTEEALMDASLESRKDVSLFYERNSGTIAKVARFEDIELLGAVRGLVLYRVEGDHRLLSSEVNGLWAAYEPTLRNYFISAASFVAGSHWYNDLKIRSIQQKLGLLEPGDPADPSSRRVPVKVNLLSLADLVEVFAKAAGAHDAFAARVDEDLGTNWRPRVDRFRALRNDFHHGRVYEGDKKSSFLGEPWDHWADDVVAACRLVLDAQLAMLAFERGTTPHRLQQTEEAMRSERESVFISYVREDSAVVGRLEKQLTDAGFLVWRDIRSIEVGLRWKDEVRSGIENGGYFIACFSKSAAAKERSYMREELVFACELMRLLPRDHRWLLPVRIDECEVPAYSIGPGETLRDLQSLDLFPKPSAKIASLVKILQRDKR